jgi:hypothetical protein
MMSVCRTLSLGEADSAPGAASPEGEETGWGAGRYLPPRGFERMAFLALVALVLGLKALTIYHFRADADETQHAHVVWE